MKYEEINHHGQRIFLKKQGDNYKIVHPIKIDGKTNWKNLIAGGNWWNLLKALAFVVIAIGCTYEFSNAVKTANYCLNNCFCGF